MNPFANWKFVPDVRQAWRWFSMRIFAIIAVVPVVWVGLPADIKALVPDSWDKWIFLSITLAAVIGGIGRVTKQDLPEVPPK
jgi:di/tricarboxylate transporter